MNGVKVSNRKTRQKNFVCPLFEANTFYPDEKVILQNVKRFTAFSKLFLFKVNSFINSTRLLSLTLVHEKPPTGERL